MAISEENKDRLKQIDRGISFPVNSEGNAVDEVGAFNIAVGVDSDLKWSPKETDTDVYGPGTIIECKLLAVDLLDSEITTNTGTEFVTLGGRYGFGTFPNITYSFKNPTTNLIVSETGFPVTTDPNVKNLTEFSIDPNENQDVNYTVEFIVEFDYSEVADQSVDELQLDFGGDTGISLLLESSTEANPARLLLESSTRVEDYGESDFSEEAGDFTIQTIVDDDGKFLLFIDEAEQKAYRKDVFTFNQTVRNFTGEKIGEVFRAAISGEDAPPLASDSGEIRPENPLPGDPIVGNPDDIITPIDEDVIEDDTEIDIEVDEGVLLPSTEFVYIDSKGNILIDSAGVTLKGNNLNDTPIQINSKLESIT